MLYKTLWPVQRTQNNTHYPKQQWNYIEMLGQYIYVLSAADLEER